jgi:hypothetical protein
MGKKLTVSQLNFLNLEVDAENIAYDSIQQFMDGGMM